MTHYKNDHQITIWLHILPEEIIQYIWKIVNKDNINKINILKQYKSMCRSFVLNKNNKCLELHQNYQNLLFDESGLYIKQRREETVNTILFYAYNHFKKKFNTDLILSFGESCGIFDHKILDGQNKILSLIIPLHIKNSEYEFNVPTNASIFTYNKDNLKQLMNES